MGLLDFMGDPDAQKDVQQRTRDMMGAATDKQFWRDFLNNGTDTLNRDAIGGLLGSPVDLINLMLRAKRPVLGSQWWGDQMASAGMVSEDPPPPLSRGLLALANRDSGR